MTGDPRIDLAALLGVALVVGSVTVLVVGRRMRRRASIGDAGLREAVGALDHITVALRADRRELLGVRADRDRLAGQVGELRRANDALLRIAGIVEPAEHAEPAVAESVEVPTLTLVALSIEDTGQAASG